MKGSKKEIYEEDLKLVREYIGEPAYSDYTDTSCYFVFGPREDCMVLDHAIAIPETSALFRINQPVKEYALECGVWTVTRWVNGHSWIEKDLFGKSFNNTTGLKAMKKILEERGYLNKKS